MIIPVLGIDIARLKFNVCLLNLNGKLKHKVFPNTEAGFQQLSAWLSKHKTKRVHACFGSDRSIRRSCSTLFRASGQRPPPRCWPSSRTSHDTITQRQVAAYAGLVPRERHRGSSVRGRTRLSKIGNARLRKALYFPAITALRCSPFFRSWAEGLQAHSKCKMSVICAVMRKLLHLAYGVLKTGKPFDPEWTKSA